MAGVLYRMEYESSDGTGGAVIYIGDDGVTGTDVGGGIYSGSLVKAGGQVRGAVTIAYPKGGKLVSGQTIAPGGSVTINLDMPADFDNGQAIAIDMDGASLVARLTAISRIPIPGSTAYSNPANVGIHAALTS